MRMLKPMERRVTTRLSTELGTCGLVDDLLCSFSEEMLDAEIGIILIFKCMIGAKGQNI